MMVLPSPDVAAPEQSAAAEANVSNARIQRSVASRLFAWPLLLGLRIYRRALSPFLAPACRFYPSCSCYALQAVEAHGPWWGSWLTLRRLLRCNPFHPGGIDLVPPPPRRSLS